jgi:hypothetical protein
MPNRDFRPYIHDFRLCLEEGRFYDAHEVLEELWFPRRFEKNSEIFLLKGFINAAVSFELLKRGRPHASAKAWKNYLKYRQLLLKLHSPYKNEYYQLTRFIETFHIQKKASI